MIFQIVLFVGRKGHHLRDCDMKDEYGQFGSKKMASSNWTFSYSHHEDFKKQKRGEKRKLKDAHDDQDYQKRSKHPTTSMGHRIIQYSSDFKQQRTRQKRHWKEAQDYQYFEMRYKHLMTSLERSLVQESADNEDYKQRGRCKKRK